MSGLGSFGARMVAGVAIFAVFGVVNQVQSANRDGDGVIVEAGDMQLKDLRVGDCWVEEPANVETEELIGEVHAVPCSSLHTFEVFAVVELSGDTFHSDDWVTAGAARECEGRFETFIGVPAPDSSLDFYFTSPTEEAWTQQNYRSAVCAVGNRDLSDSAGSMRGINR